jgi:hypothetical protein
VFARPAVRFPAGRARSRSAAADIRPLIRTILILDIGAESVGDLFSKAFDLRDSDQFIVKVRDRFGTR